MFLPDFWLPSTAPIIPLFTPGFGIPQLLGSLILRLIAWASSFRVRGVFTPKFGVTKMYQSTFWYPKMAGIFCWIFHLQIFQKLFASDSTCEKIFKLSACAHHSHEVLWTQVGGQNHHTVTLELQHDVHPFTRAEVTAQISQKAVRNCFQISFLPSSRSPFENSVFRGISPQVTSFFLAERLQSTVRPWESVIRPSSNSCKSTLRTFHGRVHWCNERHKGSGPTLSGTIHMSGRQNSICKRRFMGHRYIFW